MPASDRPSVDRPRLVKRMVIATAFILLVVWIVLLIRLLAFAG